MATKYIKFSNKADNVNRLALEKLGLSTKRNDPESIGQFGSGIKFAPIAAIRNGWEWHFTGKDNNGAYHLEYISQEEDGIDCIFYKYDDKIKASSFTVDAGSLSWVDAFQIYREAFANALDESKTDDDWSVSVVDSVSYEEGKFSCFVSASPEMMNIHVNFDKYFSNFREYLWSSSGSSIATSNSILSKIDRDFRVYCKKILVMHNDKFASVFDYDIPVLRLNEERTVRSTWDMDYEIARLIAHCDVFDIQKEFIRKLMSVDGSVYYEVSNISKHYYSSAIWDSAWNDSFKYLYAENAIIYNALAAARGVKEFISLRGYTPVFVANDDAYMILKAMGVKDYTSIADESIMYETDFDLGNYPVLEKALKVVARFEPGLVNVIESGRIGVYSGENIALGLTINMNRSQDERIILVERNHATEDLINVVATVIHEFDHLSTGQTDGDTQGRAFRDLADRRIAELMVKHYDDYPVHLIDGMVHFPMKDWLGQKDFKAFATIEFLVRLDKILLMVGNTSLFINGDAIVDYDGPSVVKLSVSDDGKSFFIPGIANVTEITKANV